MVAAKKQIKEKVVKPGNDMSSAKADQIRKKLLKTIDQNVEHIVLDFSAVKKIDPVGLSVVIAAHNTQKKDGKRLSLVNVSRINHELFQRIHLDRHFQVKTVKK